MRIYMMIIALVFAFTSGLARGAILVEDAGKQTTKTTIKESEDGFSFRRHRRFGVGVSTAGALGMVGLSLEINFTEQSSFMGGFGLGDNYQSFAMQMKHSIGGRWFVPYVGGGYARWYTAGNKNGKIDETSPTFLGDRFLSREEKRTGEFAENLIYPMAGVQYFQLRGSWAGLSAYAQILMMLDIDDFVSAPTGEFGVFYYF